MEIGRKFSIPLARIEINELKIISGQNLVFTVPTILIVKEGREILRESRFIDFGRIERVLKIVLE